jgi:hypothetical protein
MNERSHTNSVPWMYAIGPKNPLVNLNESDLTESANCVHSWYGVGVTAFIHGTEWMWLRKVMVRSWCDRVHSWYGVFVYTVQCTQHSSNSFGGFLKHNIKNPPIFIHKNTTLTVMTWQNRGHLVKIHQRHFTELMRFGKVTLRTKKNTKKWLWPVKVTL